MVLREQYSLIDWPWGFPVGFWKILNRTLMIVCLRLVAVFRSLFLNTA